MNYNTTVVMIILIIALVPISMTIFRRPPTDMEIKYKYIELHERNVLRWLKECKRHVGDVDDCNKLISATLPFQWDYMDIDNHLLGK